MSRRSRRRVEVTDVSDPDGNGRLVQEVRRAEPATIKNVPREPVRS